MKILLIEDNFAHVRQITLQAELMDFSVHNIYINSHTETCNVIKNMPLSEFSDYDVAVIDLKLGGVSDGGIAVIEALHDKDFYPKIQFIIYSGNTTLLKVISNKLDGEKWIKVDKTTDDLDHKQLYDHINSILAEITARRQKLINLDSTFIGISKAAQEVKQRIAKFAQPGNKNTVLILGESGTGKEVVAKALHTQQYGTLQKFVPVDCGSLSETLLESELFGHKKGAFTDATADRVGLFEGADGGTIFLDEITNTSLAFQSRLLRVLQEKEIRRVGDNSGRAIDVRVVVATNKDLKIEVAEKRFREDLFARLNQGLIMLPPLRERPEDIPFLANHFLENLNSKRTPRANKKFTDAALEYLKKPENIKLNVRQLRQNIERGDVNSTNNYIINEKDVFDSLAITSSNQTLTLPLNWFSLKGEKSPEEVVNWAIKLEAFFTSSEKKNLSQITAVDIGRKMEPGNYKSLANTIGTWKQDPKTKIFLEIHKHMFPLSYEWWKQNIKTSS